MIVFKNVSKKYSNGFHAVKEMNFEIQAGEFIVFIGPSGCGKTTTMKMINRLSPHTSGTILINNRDIMQEDPVLLRRNIGYVIQQAGLFPHYTIAQNIGVTLDLNGCCKEKKHDRINEMLELVGLDSKQYADKFPRQLSGGQQQRVGVARALAANPDIILMDEPFGALDPITREQIQDELLNLQKTMKKTIVFVTHDMDEALKLADRIAVIMNGSLIQFDTPEQLLREPANAFVENFIGKNRIYKNPEFIPITEIMNHHPACGLPSLTPARALNLMQKQRADTLILSDEKGQLAGIITAHDLHAKLGTIKTINEIIHKGLPFLTSSATAKDALITITTAPFGVVPVINEKRKVIGVITRSSLLTTFADHWAGKKEDE